MLYRLFPAVPSLFSRKLDTEHFEDAKLETTLDYILYFLVFLILFISA